MFSPVPAIFAIVCIVLAQDEEFFRRRERTFNGMVSTYMLDWCPVFGNELS